MEITSNVEGTIVRDKLQEEPVFIVKNTQKQISEQVAKYDYNKNPITVYELENEKEYACSKEDDAIMVVYPDAIDKHFGTLQVEADEVIELIERKKIKPYYFPNSRLEQIIN